jgi:hypothetical protein
MVTVNKRDHIINRLFLLLFTSFTLISGISISQAQNVPKHAKGLIERLISIDLANGKKQVGVLSIKIGEKKPSRLAVLLPGHPSVVRPVVKNNVMIRSELTRNFLIRARRHLADKKIATLIVDCQSEIGPLCESSYQSSKEREEDVQKLIAQAKIKFPTIDQVWLIGTSMGTISSSFMPVYNPNAYAGAIHTASITEPEERNSLYEIIDGFDYKKSGVPQFFIHHEDDPCELTTYSGAKYISKEFNIPLITVKGGSRFRGKPCSPFTQHGFRGKEKKVMINIGNIIKAGKAVQLQID